MDMNYFIFRFVLFILLIVISIIINFIMDKRSKARIIKWLSSPEVIIDLLKQVPRPIILEMYQLTDKELTGKNIVDLLNQVPEIRLLDSTIVAKRFNIVENE